MATRSVIGYETSNGAYVGVYCHYDGYPQHMLSILQEMFHIDVLVMVERALQCGGIRHITDTNSYETFNNTIRPRDEINDWPTYREQYAYRKRLDGSVDHVSSNDRQPVQHTNVLYVTNDTVE